MAEAVDENSQVKFLETELRRLARFTRRFSQEDPASKFVDLLAEVPLLNGETSWILLHVEIQGRGSKENFPLRMHRYRCLLEGRFNRPVAGLAILVQPIPVDQSEGVYRWSRFGSKIVYEYPVFKIYEGNEEELRQSDNPFDLAHYAGMQAWKHQKTDPRKLEYMKILLGELNKRQWSHEEKMGFLWFLEGVMHINDVEVWDSWEEELERRKEAGEMYVSLMERKGIEQEKMETAKRMLERGMPVSLIIDLTGLTEEVILSLKSED
ncbi:MAG: hypothetical protein GX843_06515 [Synergistaceae bacterium]|nr:hypothetical protein [Synergistaceae bacterium]